VTAEVQEEVAEQEGEVASTEEEVVEGEEPVEAEEIVERAIKAIDEARTYHFDVDTTMSTTAEVEGEEFEAATKVKSSGVLDHEKIQMEMNNAINMEVPGEDEVAMEMELYIFGGMAYMMIDKPGIGSTWMKGKALAPGWIGMSQIEYQVELLNTAKVKVIGSETVGGVDCYVLQVTPNIEQNIQLLWALAMQQTYVLEVMEVWQRPSAFGASPREMLRDYSVKQWIAKDTYFIVKAEIDIEIDMVMIGGREVKQDIATGLLYDSYNQPVSIELPDEAENAIEM